jgi:hypothetical protein
MMIADAKCHMNDSGCYMIKKYKGDTEGHSP